MSKNMHNWKLSIQTILLHSEIRKKRCFKIFNYLFYIFVFRDTLPFKHLSWHPVRMLCRLIAYTYVCICIYLHKHNILNMVKRQIYTMLNTMYQIRIFGVRIFLRLDLDPYLLEWSDPQKMWIQILHVYKKTKISHCEHLTFF